MNNVQGAITAIREAILKRIGQLKGLEAMAEEVENYTEGCEFRGGITELELLLEYLPEEKS